MTRVPGAQANQGAPPHIKKGRAQRAGAKALLHQGPRCQGAKALLHQGPDTLLPWQYVVRPQLKGLAAFLDQLRVVV